MLKTKAKFSILFLLGLFILGNSLALFHGFSHQILSGSAKQNIVTEQNLFIKIFSNHKSEKSSRDCILWAFLNSQNQSLVTDFYSFAFSGFILIFALRFFDRVKLAFLLSSNPSRAPPQIS